jgi:hypothetical protein
MELRWTSDAGIADSPSEGEWIERATTAVVTIDRNRSYGYHRYMGDLAAVLNEVALPSVR